MERTWEVLAWRDDGVGDAVRIAVPAKATLARLHDVLGRELKLARAPYSYFLSGEPWDERSQFGGKGTDAPYEAEKARVERLAWRPGANFLELSHGDDPQPVLLVVIRAAEQEVAAPTALAHEPRPEPIELDELPDEGEDEPEDDASEPLEDEEALGNWLSNLVRFAQDEPELAQPAMALSTFAGPEFRGLTVPDALPLFTGADSELHFLLWAMLDFALPGEETVAQRYSKRWRSRGTPAERRVLDRLVESWLELIEIAEPEGDGYALVRFPLEPQRKPLRVQLGTDLPRGLLAAARLIELDGELQLVPGVLDFPSARSRRVVVERLHEAQQRSRLEWPLLLKRDGHEFHRAAREAWLAQGLALAGRN
ncbi:MAG: hypothetical protein HUU28_05065 [Planctomycetaceae bacterium]|nr:hypothetical protein [Planctomycetaceae bacterium]